jgi:PAS domain S-box-containing protein
MIHLFSDRFQHMHEQTLRQHAENLERKISARTAELAESERRYKTLVEEINDGYFVVQAGRVTFANQAFCRMHGTTLEAILGRPFLSFVAPEHRDSLESVYLSVLERLPVSGQIQYDRLGVPQDKAATEVKARVTDLGQGPVIIGICRDISERVAMEAKMRDHERMAYVGHLSASLSHEIRNPLSSVKMNLQILERKLELDGFDRRRLEITVHEVSRLEGILRQLLDVARPLTITTASVNLSALAQGCVDLLAAKVHEKGLELVERYSKTLPPAHVDAGKVEQALINLLLNAIEATPEGGRITVWTRTARKGNRCLEIGVRDTGHGIDRDQMANLFTPFFTSKSQGSGLGLSNVKRIMEAHSGEVDVRSRKGRGATFILRLPCRP